MKRILITGANSYIGTSFEKYINENYPECYEIDTVDMIDSAWREKSFAGYDAIFHVAGIAHSDNGNITEEKAQLYYSVNTNLAEETAKKAKIDGVKQFVFMSSAIVYGESGKIGKEKTITTETVPTPANAYGDSKLQAENRISKFQDENFNVCILRPPMIYGKNSKGNYPTLAKLAKKMRVFPYVKNTRSMLYIENLCEFVRLIIDNREHGIFFPQNSSYTNTSEMVKLIALANGKKTRLIKGTAWMLKILSPFTGLVNKAFGNLAYDMKMSEYKENYRVCDFEESIKRTEGNSNAC